MPQEPIQSVGAVQTDFKGGDAHRRKRTLGPHGASGCAPHAANQDSICLLRSFRLANRTRACGIASCKPSQQPVCNTAQTCEWNGVFASSSVTIPPSSPLFEHHSQCFLCLDNNLNAAIFIFNTPTLHLNRIYDHGVQYGYILLGRKPPGINERDLGLGCHQGRRRNASPLVSLDPVDHTGVAWLDSWRPFSALVMTPASEGI